MEDVDVLIVGGGPAGSSCAYHLRKHGVDCLVLDRETFPRDKLCGGLITPDVLRNLEFTPEDYPHSFFTLRTFCFHYKGWTFRFRSPQYSIRRYEFDHWLLERSGAPYRQHYVRSIRRDGDHFIVADTYRSRRLVRARGTRCPVYRQFFRDSHPRPESKQIVVREKEFPYDWTDDRCHFWMFTDGLPGYSWYIPKANGILNIGVGGLVDNMKRSGDSIQRHWRLLVERLYLRGLAVKSAPNPDGYTYYLHEYSSPPSQERVFIIGDAAGAATLDLGEGIGPAIESAVHVAQSISPGLLTTQRSISSFSAVALLRSCLTSFFGFRTPQFSAPNLSHD